MHVICDFISSTGSRRPLRTVPMLYPLVVLVHEVILGHCVSHLFQCLPAKFVLNLDAAKQVSELEEVEEVPLGPGQGCTEGA